jgi:uncharacterized repeat protein (TIGR01451 family)
VATYWVDSTRPDDTGNGLSFGAAKKTLTAGLALLSTAGDILNVVNSGTYPWPPTEQNYTTGNGTSWSNFGFLIRGVSDSAATPAITKIVASGGDAVRSFIRMSAGSGYIILRNLEFDATGKELDANAYLILNLNSPTGPFWFDGVSIKVRGMGSTNSPGQRIPVAVVAGGVDDNRFYNCYLQNLNNLICSIVGATISIGYHNVLIYEDYVGAANTPISRTLASGTGDTFDFHHCTWYRSIGNHASGSVFAFSTTGTNAGLLNIHSNLVYIESTSGSANVQFLSSTGSTLPFSGMMDYNVLLGGAHVDASDLNAGGWYNGGTVDAGQDPKTHDVVAYLQAESTIFTAPGSTYAWDALGNGATITILKDLRPKLYLTASSTGGVVGALPAGQTDLGVSLIASNTAPNPGDTVTITVTATNSGTNATNVVVYAASIPSGLALVSATPSAGSYIAGVWTIGALADAGSATLTLVLTVGSDQGGNTITFVVSVASGNPANDPNSANNTASKVLLVIPPISNDPTQTPYLDVRPMFAPVLTAEVNALMRRKVNRVPVELRDDVESDEFREFSSRLYRLAPSAVSSVITAIERAKHLVIDTADSVEVSVSQTPDTDSYLPAGKRFAVLNGDFTTLKLRNPSSSATISVLLTVVD